MIDNYREVRQKIQSKVQNTHYSHEIHQHRHGYWFVSDGKIALSGGYRDKEDCVNAADMIDLGMEEDCSKNNLDLWEDGECMFDKDGKLKSLNFPHVDQDNEFWNNFGKVVLDYDMDYLFRLLYQGDLATIWLPTGTLRAIKPVIEAIPGWHEGIFLCEFLSWGLETLVNA
jgi:hypothetical protein